MKLRFLSFCCAVLCLVFVFPARTRAETQETEIADAAFVNADADTLGITAKSALLMEAQTGTVLFEKNADEALPPASVTKVMTLLLVMEAIDAGALSLDDEVTASAHAASMGGSQVYLKEGETMRVEEMLKCVVIASANDCAVALAERVAGSEESFVARMNERAAELGMQNTHFENTNGLDDTVENHLISARDVALMSRALIAHPKILEYSGIWMDTIRDGTFGLTNTNRLVRFYPGCTGLKTGSTSRAKFCISATAQRDGMSLICVIMAADSRDVRNAEAAKLLDWGFANYSVFRADGGEKTLPVQGGTAQNATVSFAPFAAVIPKGAAARVTAEYELPAVLTAPIGEGEKAGDVRYVLEGAEIGRTEVVSTVSVEKMKLGTLILGILSHFFFA